MVLDGLNTHGGNTLVQSLKQKDPRTGFDHAQPDSERACVSQTIVKPLHWPRRTGQEANDWTPYKTAPAGIIPWETPAGQASASQVQAPGGTQDPLGTYPSSASTVFCDGKPLNAPDPGPDGGYFSPWTDPAALQFCTEEVKKQLSRLQSQSQPLACSIDPASKTESQDPDGCRQLTWPSDSGHGSSATDTSTRNRPSQTLDDSARQGAGETEKAVSPPEKSLMAVKEPSEMRHSRVPLPPGFACASDLPAVARQQRAPPQLRRKLVEWGVPPRVAAVSSFRFYSFEDKSLVAELDLLRADRPQHTGILEFRGCVICFVNMAVHHC